MTHDRIAVVDFGGQYAHLIATKLRRIKVLAEILQPEDPIERFREYRGIILSGSPALSSHDEDGAYTRTIYDLDIPILGFCFGHQEIAKHYGGRVEHTKREYGPASLEVRGSSPIFAGLGPRETVWMSHGDTVTVLPPGFVEIGLSAAAGESSAHPNAAIADESRRRYGFQFHPEVDDTVHGEAMLRNFALGVCGCEPTWSMDTFVDEICGRLKAQAGGRGAFLLASGGVDSTVCAVLLGRALGAANVHLLHIDNGLMRKDESRRVLEALGRHGFGENLHFVDASARFLDALAGVTEPERKRRIIGDTFLDVYAEAAGNLNLSGCLLAQGTIYPDTIETGGTRRADVIKTHHNRVPAIQRMVDEGRVLEPLADLYKVEVRELGERLGLPEDLVWRHPFPGPGLGIRLLCNDGKPARSEPGAAEALAGLLKGSGWRGRLLPVRSVGVKADLRSYEQPVMLWGPGSQEAAGEMAVRVFKEVPGVNRCIFDLSGRGFDGAEAVAATVTRPRLDLLREADALVMEALRRHGIYRAVWQCPTVFLPMRLDGRGDELVVIRPVLSERAMTARPAVLPGSLLAELRASLLQMEGIAGVALDVTTKPPGTIEWE